VLRSQRRSVAFWPAFFLWQTRRMPIKSKAQRRKFAQLLTQGKISEEVFERWNREAGANELPEHVKPKGKKRTKKKSKKSKKKR
jgi:hypothetical protein